MRANQGRGVRSAILACVAVLALPAAAADYFVNDRSMEGDVALPGCPSMPTGFDTASCGSCDRPCASAQFLYDSQPLGRGDTVHLNTGRYEPNLAALTAPVLVLADDTKTGTPEAWLTFTGPVDAQGRVLRDAEGRLLAQITGRGLSAAGVVVGVPGIRLQALGFTAFRDFRPPYCGTGVRVAPTADGVSFSLRDLAFFELAGSCASAIDVDARGLRCERCEILDNEMSDSPTAASAALWIHGAAGTEIARNTIHDWGRANDDGAISLLATQRIYLHHNVIRDNASAGIILRDSRRTVIESNTLRANLRLDASGSGSTAELLFLGAGENVVRNNILSPRAERGALAFDGEPGTLTYNGYTRSAGGYLVEDLGSGFRSDVLEEWQAVYGQDHGSLLVDAPGFASDTDLHLRSTAGRWAIDGTWVLDADSSPFLDRGDPGSDATQEPFPSGERINLGAFGNSEFASKTPLVLSLVAGDGQLGPVGEVYPEELVVRATGSEAVPAFALEDLELTYEVVQGHATIETLPMLTDADGRARVKVTPTRPGTVVVEVRVVGAPGTAPVRFTLQSRPDYRVACGCTQAAPFAPWAALLLLGTLRLRARRDPRV